MSKIEVTPQKKVSVVLTNKIQALSCLLIELHKGALSAVDLYREVVQQAREEGLTEHELRSLIWLACQSRGLTERTYYRLLPQELKNPVFVNSGKKSRLNQITSSAAPDKMSGSRLEQLLRENAYLKAQLRQKEIRLAVLEEELATCGKA